MTIHQFQNDLEGLDNIKVLVQTYEEIAAIRMRKVRSAVLANREFNAGITEIFQELMSSYKKELYALMQKKQQKDISKFSLIPHNGKTVCVLLSANVGLYGDIVRRTYTLFNDEVRNIDADIILVGRLGKTEFEHEFPERKYSYIELGDNVLDTEILKKLIEQMIMYEKVLVFFGQFQTITNQKPVMLNVYGNQNISDNTLKSQVLYFFEPSLERIILIFETELFASVFEQTLHESQLAKLASRLYTLDLATENIKNRELLVTQQIRILHHRLNNSKQQSTLSGMTLWNR